MTRLAMGRGALVRGSDQLGDLRDHSALRHDPEALRAALAADGYLFLRDLLDREAVLAARERVLTFEAAEPRTMGNPAITHDPAVLAVLEAPQLFALTEQLYGEPVTTTAYKWLRTMRRGGCTGAHFDWVYMGRGSQRLVTSWLPIGDVPARMGGLAILEGSHRIESMDRLRRTYGAMDVDRDKVQGWFSEDPAELAAMAGTRWLTADYRAGDALLFTMHTMHMSMTQDTDQVRVTCDVRWQPVSDPRDERWFGPTPTGHRPAAAGPERSMSEARRAWGV